MSSVLLVEVHPLEESERTLNEEHGGMTILRSNAHSQGHVDTFCRGSAPNTTKTGVIWFGFVGTRILTMVVI